MSCVEWQCLNVDLSATPNEHTKQLPPTSDCDACRDRVCRSLRVAREPWRLGRISFLKTEQILRRSSLFSAVAATVQRSEAEMAAMVRVWRAPSVGQIRLELLPQGEYGARNGTTRKLAASQRARETERKVRGNPVCGSFAYRKMV